MSKYLSISDMLVELVQGNKVCLELPQDCNPPPLPEDIKQVINNLRVRQSRTKSIYESLGLIYEPKSLVCEVDTRIVTLSLQPLKPQKRYVGYIITPAGEEDNG